jgi:hypothetical protein
MAFATKKDKIKGVVDMVSHKAEEIGGLILSKIPKFSDLHED